MSVCTTRGWCDDTLMTIAACFSVYFHASLTFSKPQSQPQSCSRKPTLCFLCVYTCRTKARLVHMFCTEDHANVT